MVLRGFLSVRLVDATTKKPFQEHLDPCGNVYTEVEPDREYFVSVVPSPRLARVVGCRIAIDGHDLGSGTVIVPNSPAREIGASRLERGVETMTSFRFQRPNQEQGTLAGSGGSGMILGSVTVKVHVLYFVGFVPYFDKRSNTISGTASLPIHAPAAGMGKKLLRSGLGTVSQSNYWGQGCQNNYMVGPLLDTFTFHYCAAPRLVQVGILKPPCPQHCIRSYTNKKRSAGKGVPKPALSPQHYISNESNKNKRPAGEAPSPQHCISNGSSNKRPATKDEMDMLSKVKHKRFKFDGVCSDGTHIKTKTTEHDFYDLTELEDD